jgi:phage terminase large subunit GpA-like protein
MSRESVAWRPKERLSPVEWAEKNLYLSQGAAPEPGYYRGDRAPYQKGIINAHVDENYRQIVFVSSTQVGKTLALMATMGFVIDSAPGAGLLVQPVVQMAEEFSRERLNKMIEDSPALLAKIPVKSRNAANTLLKKEFPGGFIALTGANTPTGLAARTIQYLWADEIDRYPLSVGRDGDPLAQAIKRTANYWNAKVWLVSTPTYTDTSRILKAWETSNKQRYFLPCPYCGHFQHLVWEQIQYPGKSTPDAQPELAQYICISCNEGIQQGARTNMLALGEWRATEPKPKSPRVAGFHLNELYSPWREWADVALDYEEAKKDPLQLQVWTNTSLGLGWDQQDREELSWEKLQREAADSDYERMTIPSGCSFLTAGVDVQSDRLEVSVWGWGENDLWCMIDHQQILGSPDGSQVWNDLENYLDIGFERDGSVMRSVCTFVDSGYNTKTVYKECKLRVKKNWHAIKGKAGDRKLISPPTVVEVDRLGRKLPGGVKLRVIGVDIAKELLQFRLGLSTDNHRKPRFPVGLDAAYFEGLASEIKVKKHRLGLPYYLWEKLPGISRNEPWDCFIYAFCAANMAGLDRNLWRKFELKIKADNRK